MKGLNLYAGLGGNRKKWPGNVEVTAVEYRPDIAAFYQDQYPQDKVIVGDAHQFLLDHYREFDFAWCSTPCPTHSRARQWNAKGNEALEPVYPDMSLWQEIIFLKYYFSGRWVVENVDPFYDIDNDLPMLPPHQKIGRHIIWSNFVIPKYTPQSTDLVGGKREDWQKYLSINIDGYKFQDRTDKLLRNCVHPDLGLHVFLSANEINPITIDQMALI